MLKHWILIIATICMFIACNKQSGYAINGIISNADGKKIILKAVHSDSSFIINSCFVKKGKFKMNGIVEYPEYCELFAGDNGPLLLFIENSNITLDINMKDMNKSKVTGSKENDLFIDFNYQMDEFNDKISRINSEYKMLRFTDEIDTIAEKNLLASMDSLTQQRIFYMKQFAEEQQENIVTAFIIDRYLAYHLQPDEMELYANNFNATNIKSTWIQSINEKVEINKKITIGQPFVDIKMKNPDGNDIALSDYAGKGNYLLIDFWASWCIHCRIINPEIIKIFNKYKDTGFVIIGISLDKNSTDWKNAIEDDKLSWYHMSDLECWQSKGVKLYAVNAIPHNVLLDKDGFIIAKDLNPEEMDSWLANND